MLTSILNYLQGQGTSDSDSFHLSGLLLVAFVTLPYEVSTQALSETMIPSFSHPFFYWPSVFKADVSDKRNPQPASHLAEQTNESGLL